MPRRCTAPPTSACGEQDFEALTHHDGLSPAWPLRYADFEPFYQRAEQLYHVHGLRGEDPTEPPASGPYPHPPVAHEPRMQRLVDDLQSAGLHPFHAPSGVMLDEANMAFSRCRKCNCCDGFPCLMHAKSDAEVIGMRPALAAATVSLLHPRPCAAPGHRCHGPQQSRRWSWSAMASRCG